MCGIAGIINLKRKNCAPLDIERMCKNLSHRGPDGEGFYVNGHISLGHRRLSIIDLTPSGRQPMFNENKDIVLVYNGEIYNFKQLRQDLERLGHRFSSKTDAEVVLHAYEEWGVSSVKKFNGMFAFAIWDEKKGILTLARDRYGIKPLYYWQKGDLLLFASEIKAFLGHHSFNVELDHKCLLEYFTFQNVFTQNTLFKGVALFPAGNYMQMFFNKSSIVKKDIKQYWDFSFKEDNSLKEGECVKELDRLFKHSVDRQLVSDVAVGSYLSGGIDSGSIVAVASSRFKELKTFCIGFDLSSASGLELSFDERRRAEYLSYLNQTEHYEMVLKSGDMKRCLPYLVWHLEDLRLGQSYPNFYASKLASRFVKVCLSGIGGDELFAGYPWRYYKALRSRDFDEYICGYYEYWQRLVSSDNLRKLFSPISANIDNFCTEDIFRDVFSGNDLIPQIPSDYINHSLYFEAKTFLHGLFIVEDKLSMAHSLEVRVPFMDNDIVDFAGRIPVNMKLKNIKRILNIDEDELAKRDKYFMKTHDGKMILRKVLKGYVGHEVVNQYKQGFCGPDASWFKGESIEYVKDLILNKKANIYEYFDYKVAARLIQEHISGKCNRRLFIWSLLCFEWWLKIFINRQIPEDGSL